LLPLGLLLMLLLLPFLQAGMPLRDVAASGGIASP
jgi:hypothetical protein